MSSSSGKLSHILKLIPSVNLRLFYVMIFGMIGYSIPLRYHANFGYTILEYVYSFVSPIRCRYRWITDSIGKFIKPDLYLYSYASLSLMNMFVSFGTPIIYRAFYDLSVTELSRYLRYTRTPNYANSNELHASDSICFDLASGICRYCSSRFGDQYLKLRVIYQDNHHHCNSFFRKTGYYKKRVSGLLTDFRFVVGNRFRTYSSCRHLLQCVPFSIEYVPFSVVRPGHIIDGSRHPFFECEGMLAVCYRDVIERFLKLPKNFVYVPSMGFYPSYQMMAECAVFQDILVDLLGTKYPHELLSYLTFIDEYPAIRTDKLIDDTRHYFSYAYKRDRMYLKSILPSYLILPCLSSDFSSRSFDERFSAVYFDFNFFCEFWSVFLQLIRFAKISIFNTRFDEDGDAPCFQYAITL